ncbi:hypothetical protein LJC68_04375 [Bacteroidales bacterium OttesenSCG-928-B11]|nr:hypothetical protein [Bacteroidales bacterium OttesenSCG-928-C03]MDL2312096.1 hypothetical protein [Bacteroidales bacterium OttesenSCG-928-B11]MDL2326066.1 hypothetical protein [Bacteroidales bacterium OttesenSCG-928-A14]
MPEKKVSHRKTWAIVGICFLAFLLILTGFGIYVIHNIERKGRQLIIEKVEKSTDNLYTLDISKMKVNLSKGKLALVDITLKVNENRLFADSNKLPKAYYLVHAERIELSAMHIITALREKSELVIDKLEVMRPKIAMYPLNGIGKDTLKEINDQQLLPSFVHGLTLKEILVDDGSFKRYILGNQDSVFFHIDGINLVLNTLYINPEEILSTDAPLFKNIRFESNETKCSINDYEVSVRNIHFDDESRRLTVDSVVIMPIFNKYIFPIKTGRPTTAEITMQQVAVCNFNAEELIYHHRLLIDSIQVDNYHVHAYKNKNVPPTPIIKPAFSQMILQIPIPMKINKVKILGGNIHYEETAKGKEAIGTVFFNDFKGEIRNITNIEDRAKSYCEADVYGTVYKTGHITLRYSFPIDVSSTHFELNGKIRNLQLSEVNAITEASGNIRIESGHIPEFSFTLSGNDKTSTANVLMLYNDLKVSLLKPDHEKKRSFISAIANDFVLISDNPKGKKDPREVRAHFDRNRYYFQFHQIWNTLYGGIKESVGIGKKEEKMMEKHKKND